MASTAPIPEKDASQASDKDHGDVDIHGVKSEQPVAGTSPDDFGFTEEEQKSILKRVDRRLVTTVGLMYCVSLMDRTNLGAANIAGMDVDLGLQVGNRYVSSLAPIMMLEGCTDREETVRHLPRLLRDLHCLPAAFDRYCSQGRPSHPSRRHHAPLGRRHYRNGVREEVGPDGCAARHSRHSRGRLLPQLRVPPQHVVHEM